MKIAIITHFGMPLNKEAYGYYARLYYLANGLIERGHAVTVLAHPKTKTKAKLIKTSVRKIEWETKLITYANFFKKYGNQFDIINAQTDHLCCFLSPFIKTPTVHTIIFGHFWEQVQETLKIVKNQFFITISNSNKKCYPFLNWQGVIHNGLNINDFAYNKKAENYLLFLSRVNYEKGVEDAIRAAKQTKNKLIIAGPVEEEYFKKIIKPQLNKNIIYFGIADFKQKINLFKNAKALLHPHLYPEGFGNSMVEAQACGTPVIAYPHGSTSEVIQDKKTGFIVKNINSMKKAIKNIEKINRIDCRKFVEKNFTIDKMVNSYEKIFKKLLKIHYEK